MSTRERRAKNNKWVGEVQGDKWCCVISLHSEVRATGSMPESLPGKGSDTLFFIVVRIMLLFPLLRSRQCPIVEPESLIRETFQKGHVGAGQFEILTERHGKFAPHIRIEQDRFGERLSEWRLMKRRDLPANR